MTTSINSRLDEMIAELKSHGLKAETIVMGKGICIQWLVEISRDKPFTQKKSGKWKLSHSGIPVVVCESGILEVVPNAKALLSRGE